MATGGIGSRSGSISDGGGTEDENSEPTVKKLPSGTMKTEAGNSQFYSKVGIIPIYDSLDRAGIRELSGSVKVKAMTKKVHDLSSRFPKIDDCAHFHYDFIELGPLQVSLLPGHRDSYKHNEDGTMTPLYFIKVSSNEKMWTLKRTFENFRLLDKQLHKCIYDRKFSKLPELRKEDGDEENLEGIPEKLAAYLNKFSEIAGNMISCGPILNWLEMDNHGNRLLITSSDDSDINIPAIAAAHVVKSHNAQATDELSLKVGDFVSVIDMPPVEDTVWWRGKKASFEVGFFPAECVEIIGSDNKMPQTVEAKLAEAQKPVLQRRGKVISFLSRFFTHRPTRNALKQTGIVKERVFGCDLGEHLLNSGLEVPQVLQICSEVIEKHGIVDGIYRLSGVASNIQKLRLAFDEGTAPDLKIETQKDIHSISSLLKMYFRELPNPLLTYQLYSKFVSAVHVSNEDEKWQGVRSTLQQLPPPHYRTATYLLRHLAKIASHGENTGMGSKNLAIVWAPNLLRSKELEQGGGAAALQGVGVQAVVTEFLIKHAETIFGDQSAKKLARPKSLCVATPTKLLSLEEAQQKQKYIEVGGGPAALPEFHTILEHPRKRSRKSGGWKALFKGSGGKASSGAAKPKYRKSSTPGEIMPSKFSGKQHNTDVSRGDTRRKLRMVKSADSLATMSALPHAGALIANPYAEESPKLERPKSVDDSSITTGTTVVEAPMPRSNSLESYFEMPIDADAQSDVTEDSIVSEQAVSQKPSKKKQRTASEPSTPQELKVFEIELESKKSHRSPSLKQKIAKALSPKARRKRSTPSPSNGKRLVSAPILQTPPSSESSSPLCHKSFSFSDSASLEEKFQSKNGGGGSGVFYVPNETQEPGEILELAHSPGAKRKSVRRFSEFDSAEDVSQDTSQTLEASQSDGNLSSSTLDLSIENLSTENYNLVEEVQSAIQERGQKDSSPDILGSRSSEPDLLEASKDSSAQSVPNTNDSVSSNTKEDSEQSPAAPSEQRKSLKIELRLGTPDSDKFPNLMLTSSDSLFSANSDLKTPDSDVITLDSSSTINSEIMEQWSRTLGADSTAESCDNLSCHSWNFANNEDRRLSQSSDEYFSTLSRDSEQGTLTRSDWGTLRDSNFDTLSDSGGHIDYSSEVGDQGTLTRNHDGNQAEPQEQTDFLSDSELIPKETLDLITSGASFDHLGGITTLTADSSEGSGLSATQGSKEGATSTTTFLETDIDLLDSSNSHGAPSPVASLTSQSPCPLSPDMAVSPVRQESVDDPAVSQSSELPLEQRPAFTMSLSSDGGLGDSGEYDNALNRRHSSQGSLHSGDYDNVISHRHESLGSLLDQITPDGSSSLASEDLLSQLMPLSDVAETSLPNTTEDAPPVDGGSLGECEPAESSAIVEPAPDNTETADGEEQAPVTTDTTEGTVGDVIEEQVPPVTNIGDEAPCVTSSSEELVPVSTVMSVSTGDQDNNLSAEVKTLPTEPTEPPVASEEIDEHVDKVPAPSPVVTETDREDVIVVKPRKILVVKPDTVDSDTKPAPAQDVKPDSEMSDENTVSGENVSGLPFRDKSSPVDDSTLYSPRGIGLPHREESVVLRRREITAPSFPSPRSQMVTQVDISDTFVQANPAQASSVQANSAQPSPAEASPAQESSVLASPTEESSPPIVNDQPTQHKRLIRPFEYEDDSIFKSYKSTDSGSDSSSLERDNIPAWDYGRSESKKGIQKFDRDRRQERWKNSSQKKDGDAATKSGRPSSIGDKVALFSQSQDSTNQNVIKHDGTQAGEVRAYVLRQPRLEPHVSSDTSSYVKDHFNIEESVDSEDSCFGSFPRRSKRMGQVETSRDLSTPHQYTPTAQDDSMKTPSIDSAVSSAPQRHHSGGSSSSHPSFKSVAPPSESQVVSTPKTIQVQHGRVQGRAKKPPLHDSKDDKSKEDMRRYIEKPVEIIEKQPISTSKGKEDSAGGPEKVNSDSGAKRTALVQRKSSVRALMSQFETKSGPDSEAVDSGKSQKQELTEEKDKPHSVLSRQDSTNTSDSSLITMTPGDSDSLGKLYRRGLSHEQGQGRYSGRRYGPSEEPIVRPSMLRKLSAPPVFTGAGHTEFSLPSQTSQSSSPMSPS